MPREKQLDLTERERVILSIAIRELLYATEEGAIRDLIAEAAIDGAVVPTTSEVADLLERVNGEL